MASRQKETMAFKKTGKTKRPFFCVMHAAPSVRAPVQTEICTVGTPSKMTKWQNERQNDEMNVDKKDNMISGNMTNKIKWPCGDRSPVVASD